MLDRAVMTCVAPSKKKNCTYIHRQPCPTFYRKYGRNYLGSSESFDEHNEARYARGQKTRDVHRANDIENDEAWASQSLAGGHVGFLLRAPETGEETDCKETKS
jgi:hypothetical protein